MIQVIATGVWAVIVFAAANIFIPSLLGGSEQTEEVAASVELMSVTIQSNVPTIKDGAVRGFIISNVTVQLDESVVHGDATQAEQFLKHEIFEAIYGAPGNAFIDPKKEDLLQFAKTLLPSVNRRLGNGAVQDLLIQEMYFVPLSFLRGRRFNKFLAGRLEK